MIGSKKRPAEQEPVNTGPKVSELLKTTRERLGHDLQTVAQVLRIRYVYLEAIEQGRYDDLPGKTYVVGFVRAYSEHLGLDVEEVVSRFKAEIDGLEHKAEFVFPSPVTEQSVPGGAIILISLIILGAAYGGWYFLSSQDRDMAELVPDLPAKFAEMVNRVKESKNDPVADEQPAQEEVKDEAPVETETKVEETVSQEDTQEMAQRAREAVEKAEEEQKEEATQVVETVKVEPKPVEEKKPEPAVEETKKEEPTPEKVEEKVEEPAQEIEKTVKAKIEERKEEVAAVVEPVKQEEQEPAEKKEKTKVETAPVEEEKKPTEPAVMIEKIMLKAVDYAWIQVVDADGKVKHTQVLNEGDEYQIPALQGLVLRTGNAGGLEIFVDGKKAPSVGDSGEVRRKILLSPNKLMAGNAVES